MKQILIVFLLIIAQVALADSLPSFSLQPGNQTVVPSTTATFTVSATGATSYQWRFNGIDIPGATSATLQVANAQTTNSGYYNVIAKNATGWVPSQMAYLFLDYTFGGSQPTAGGVLPLSNTNDIYFAGDVEAGTFGGTVFPDNGTVQIVAGPELDQMQRVGLVIHYRPPPFSSWFSNGYFNATRQIISTIKPGQSVYYGVVVNFTNGGQPYIFPSTIMKLEAGTNGLPAPSGYGLKFPGWFTGEGVEPFFFPGPPANQLRVSGETCSFTNSYFAYDDFGIPTAQWRKNGQPIPGATNNPFVRFALSNSGVFTLTNLQASDAGIYDLIIYGNEWVVSPQIMLSIQTTNGQGVFQNPRFAGTNFVSDLVGAASRNYKVQQSSNLLSWSDLVTLSNLSGTVTFTNPPAFGPIFYRTVLLP